MVGSNVLADRMAAHLGLHDPGWRLPRHSALARRFNVSVAEIDAAITELTERRLLRRLPDGQVYRVSPAEYLISLESVLDLTSQIDPMGAEMACEARHVTWRAVPEDIGWALGLGPGDQACVIRHTWTMNGERSALSKTYLPGGLAAQVPALRIPGPTSSAAEPHSVGDEPRWSSPAEPEPPDDKPSLAALLNVLPLQVPGEPGGLTYERSDGGSADGTAPSGTLAGQPRGLYLEMQPPPPAVARSLRLTHGQPAVLVNVRFDDPALGTPVAITVAALRPDMFRIVVTSAAHQLPEGSRGVLAAWTHVEE